jgi:hypothetical protein
LQLADDVYKTELPGWRRNSDPARAMDAAVCSWHL